MIKAEIASEIAKTTGIDKATVVTVIEQFMTVVKDSLAHGENVYLRGFGSFIVLNHSDYTNSRATIGKTWTWKLLFSSNQLHSAFDLSEDPSSEYGYFVIVISGPPDLR